MAKTSNSSCSGTGCLGFLAILFVGWLIMKAVEAVQSFMDAVASLWIFQEPPEELLSITSWFVTPVASLLSHIWITPHTWFGLILTFLLSWWLYLTVIRLTWSFLGRAYGFYNPAHFHYFTKFWLPWRPIYQRVGPPIAGWIEERRMGKRSTGRPAGLFETMSYVYKPGDIYLGRLRPFRISGSQPVGIDGRGGMHLCMFAGTGSGKTTHLISMLGLHKGTAFIIDPKGQIANAIARRLGDGGDGIIGKGMKVRILDPTGVVPDHPSLLAQWNCFEELRSAGERAKKRNHNPDNAVVDFALKIIDALIVQQNSKQDPFWTDAPRDFLHGLILHVYTTEPHERQTLGRVYQLVTMGLPEESPDLSERSGFDMLLYAMSKNDALGGVIAQSAAAMRDAGSQTAGNLLATMRSQLQWLKLPALQVASGKSSFRLEELHSGNLVLFVCAKFTDISKTFPGWFRLLSVLALAVFEDINRSLSNPCLFVLDEFPSLGKLDAVQAAAPTMRSYGIRLLTISQNVGQLRELYKNWETFLDNACTWWMATQHSDTLAYLEKRFGKTTIKHKNGGQHDRDVMTGDQIERLLKRGNVIVTRGERPFILKPEPYFKALPVCFYDADKNYRENDARAFTRKLFAEHLKKSIRSLPAIPDNFKPVPSTWMYEWTEATTSEPGATNLPSPVTFNSIVADEANQEDKWTTMPRRRIRGITLPPQPIATTPLNQPPATTPLDEISSNSMVTDKANQTDAPEPAIAIDPLPSNFRLRFPFRSLHSRSGMNISGPPRPIATTPLDQPPATIPLDKNASKPIVASEEVRLMASQIYQSMRNEKNIPPEPGAATPPNPVTFSSIVMDEAKQTDELEPPAAPDSLPIDSHPSIWPAADPDFVRLFVECFNENGRFRTVRTRRIVYDGFAKHLERGGDFQTLHISFADWLSLPASKLEKGEAEVISGFFDIAVNRFRKKHRKAAAADD